MSDQSYYRWASRISQISGRILAQVSVANLSTVGMFGIRYLA